MMRVTREQEQYIGRARPALHSRVKIGFRKDGRITALDGFAIVENGPYDVVGDARSAGDHISLSYQPMAMRWRSVSVLTNTPPRGAQRAPGGMQGNSLMAPIMARAAHKLGIDQVAIHRINAPEGKAPFGGPNARGVQSRTTSAFLKDAIDKGAELFNWEARKARSGQRNGSKVRGLGMAVSAYSAGSVGFDGLFVIKPDGTMQVQSGIGNLGTESVFDVHRVAAELVGMPWEKVEVVWGNTAKYLPSTCNQGGSQTTHAMTRAAHAAGTDAKKKLQEIAAKTLGGTAETYQVADGRVFSGSRSMTLAQAAKWSSGSCPSRAATGIRPTPSRRGGSDCRAWTCWPRLWWTSIRSRRPIRPSASGCAWGTRILGLTLAEVGYVSDGPGLTGRVQWTHPNFTGGARSLSASLEGQSGVGAVGTEAEQLISGTTQPDPALRVRATSVIDRGAVRGVPGRPAGSLDRRRWHRDPPLSAGCPFLAGAAIRVQRPAHRRVPLRRRLGGRHQPARAPEPPGPESDRFARPRRGREHAHLGGSFGKLNDLADPRRGWLLKPTAEVTVPGGLSTVQFVRLDLAASGFHPLGRRVVLAARLLGGPTSSPSARASPPREKTPHSRSSGCGTSR